MPLILYKTKAASTYSENMYKVVSFLHLACVHNKTTIMLLIHGSLYSSKVVVRDDVRNVKQNNYQRIALQRTLKSYQKQTVDRLNKLYA